MSPRTLVFSLVSITVLATCRLSLACTQIQVMAKDGSPVIARTMEFAPNLASHISTSPAGKVFQSPSPDGNNGLQWTSKYGYVLIDSFGQKRVIDGMNTEGLSMGWLYLPEYAEYPKVPSGMESSALNYLFVGDWVLGNFTTVDQVKKAIGDVHVYGSEESFGPFKDVIFPLHLIVTDASGKSLVVEWVAGKVKVYDNAPGILTNSPEFSWQLINLKNYMNMTPYAPSPVVISGVEYSAVGQGAGSIGIPGDFSPPSRFVKMSFLVKNALPVDTADEAVVLAEHIINNADIPKGAVRGAKGGEDEGVESTQWTVFKDLKNRELYYKSYDNTTMQVIDLKKLDFSKGAPQLSMPIESKQIRIDATDRFKKSISKK